MWTYNQSSGQLSNGTFSDNDCYSGAFPEGFNDPAKQDVIDVGPIPEGDYDFIGQPFTDKEHGPYVVRIIPRPETQMFGRSGFLLHGKPLPPKDIRAGSEGCICACLQTRVRVYQSGDSWLRVVSGLVTVDPEIQV